MRSIQGKEEFLSKVDRELLKVLPNPNGKRSSILLSNKLGIPKTTIQRRRKRLEKQLLQLLYSLFRHKTDLQPTNNRTRKRKNKNYARYNKKSRMYLIPLTIISLDPRC